MWTNTVRIETTGDQNNWSSTECSANMVSEISIKVTRIRNISSTGKYHVWREEYQSCFAIHPVLSNFVEQSFQGPLKRVLSYLSRQNNLISHLLSPFHTV